MNYLQDEGKVNLRRIMKQSVSLGSLRGRLVGDRRIIQGTNTL
jgi:hypothetical protein